MEEHWLKMFANRVISKMLGPKMQEVTGGWRKLHNEGFHLLLTNYYLGEQLRGIRWVGYVADMRKKKFKQDFGRET